MLKLIHNHIVRLLALGIFFSGISGAFANQLDILNAKLRERPVMVAALAAMLVVPDKCLKNGTPLKQEDILRFTLKYGYTDVIPLLDEAKIKMQKNEATFKAMDKNDQTYMSDMVCGMAHLYSTIAKGYP